MENNNSDEKQEIENENNQEEVIDNDA